MLIIRGVNLFPTQVEELIVKERVLAPHYVIEVSRPKNLDEVTVHVERTPMSGFADGEEAAGRLSHLIKSLIGISADVKVAAPGTIERSVGKAKRVVDRRPKG
jgi:phenylacetate-CoA ligase